MGHLVEHFSADGRQAQTAAHDRLGVERPGQAETGSGGGGSAFADTLLRRCFRTNCPMSAGGVDFGGVGNLVDGEEAKPESAGGGCLQPFAAAGDGLQPIEVDGTEYAVVFDDESVFTHVKEDPAAGGQPGRILRVIRVLDQLMGQGGDPLEIAELGFEKAEVAYVLRLVGVFIFHRSFFPGLI